MSYPPLSPLLPRINILDDLLAILAVLGIAAAGGVCQLTYLAFTTDPYDFANTGIIADSFRDSWFVMLLKAATSVISFTMFIILIARMFVLHRLSVLQNHEPQLSSPCPWLFPCSCGKGHQRFALLVDGGWRNMLKCRYFYCTGVAVRTMAEIIVCVPHVPPGVDFSFQMKLPIWGEEDINYDMHVNILSMIAVARIYVFLRPLRNRVGFRSPRAAYIGKINGVQADSVSFALKLLLKKAPWATIVIGTCCTVIITSTLMWFVEKYSPLGFDTFEQVRVTRYHYYHCSVCYTGLSLSLSLSALSFHRCSPAPSPLLSALHVFLPQPFYRVGTVVHDCDHVDSGLW